MTSPVSRRIDNLAFLKGFADSVAGNRRVKSVRRSFVRVRPRLVFPVGVTNVTCTATDGAGLTSACTFTVTVNDAEPPDITSVTASPSILWPPNHRMVPVTVTATAIDNCDPSPTCAVTSVTSSEPVTGQGYGKFAPDWILTGGQTVSLRSERAGFGPGRIYSVTDTCSDGSGNQTSEVVEVTVPHNQ
jgi:hypothetical protein